MRDELEANFQKACLPRMLRMYTNDMHLIEDICHDVYVATISWLQRATLTKPPKPEFFRQAAKHKWYDHLRFRSRQRHLQEEMSVSETLSIDPFESYETAEMIEKEIHCLPAQYQQALRLIMLGYDVAKTASHLQISHDKARQLRTRAMKQLRENIVFSQN